MKYNKEWATYYSVTNSMYLLYTTKGLGPEEKITHQSQTFEYLLHICYISPVELCMFMKILST